MSFTLLYEEGFRAMMFNASLPLRFEPISIAKCVVAADVLSELTYVSPNVLELHAMADACRGKSSTQRRDVGDTDMSAIMEDAAVLVRAGVKHVIVTMGADGVLLANRDDKVEGGGGGISFHHLRPNKLAQARRVTGAGDSLVGATVWGLLRGHSLDQAVACGMTAGLLSVEAEESVSPLISPAVLQDSALAHTYTTSLVQVKRD